MKRMIPILMVMTLFLTGCAVSTPAPEANTYSQVTMQEAVEMMEKEENYIILDVRTQEEFAAGHIPGAIVIPNQHKNALYSFDSVQGVRLFSQISQRIFVCDLYRSA